MNVKHLRGILSSSNASCLHKFTANVRRDIDALKYNHEGRFYDRQQGLCKEGCLGMLGPPELPNSKNEV